MLMLLIGAGSFGLVLAATQLVRAVRNATSFVGELSILAIVVGLLFCFYWLFNRILSTRLRLQFDENGIFRTTGSGRHEFISWAEIQRVGYADAGRGDSEWVLFGDGRKFSITPGLFDDEDAVRRILIERISPRTTIPEYLRSKRVKS